MAGDKLRIICGPTAAGKSTIALELAESSDAAIVSADSRQIYCHFDIGTAKPTREECARVTHYGIDVAEPTERFSAARWATEAREWIECAAEIEKAPLVVGGTGLYIKALVEPLFDAPEVDPVLRAQLEGELEGKSVEELRDWCRRLDPSRAHLGRTQLVRAIETVLLSGVRISELHAEHKAAAPSNTATNALYLVIDPEQTLATIVGPRSSGYPSVVPGGLALQRVTRYVMCVANRDCFTAVGSSRTFAYRRATAAFRAEPRVSSSHAACSTRSAAETRFAM